MFMQTIVHIYSPKIPSRSGISSSLVDVITSAGAGSRSRLYGQGYEHRKYDCNCS